MDVKELKPEVRSRVEAVIAKASEEDLKSLRGSIDASTEATSALKAKGHEPRHRLSRRESQQRHSHALHQVGVGAGIAREIWTQ